LACIAVRPRGLNATESARGRHEFVDYHLDAQALGFHGSFVTEHHFTSIAARTTRLCLSA
jgi:hypothetical protein